MTGGVSVHHGLATMTDLGLTRIVLFGHSG
jgi:hypothetical protein